MAGEADVVHGTHFAALFILEPLAQIHRFNHWFVLAGDTFSVAIRDDIPVMNSLLRSARSMATREFPQFSLPLRNCLPKDYLTRPGIRVTALLRCIHSAYCAAAHRAVPPLPSCTEIEKFETRPF
jgi:hypothetical protein